VLLPLDTGPRRHVDAEVRVGKEENPDGKWSHDDEFSPWTGRLYPRFPVKPLIDSLEGHT
jgi:hypothetical protein